LSLSKQKLNQVTIKLQNPSLVQESKL
jgi:hypothetical protein